MTETPSPSPTITLVIPVLNEVEGLKASVPDIDRSLFTEILVIDGGSTDGSLEYAFAQGLTVVSQLRPGLHYAVFDILRVLGTDYVIEFSPDGNCPPEYFDVLCSHINEGYDLVVVSRYLQDAKSYDDHFVSAFGNWLFTKLMAPLSEYPITDALTIYRGFRREIIFDKDFERYLKGPMLEPLVTGICGIRGMTIAEIPGDEPERIGGETKRSILYNGSCILLMIFRLYLQKYLRIIL